jgi:hypothetical protein
MSPAFGLKPERPNSPFGCFGLLLGSMLGALLVLFFFLLLARQASTSPKTQPAAAAADTTVFVSERTLNRLASESLRRPLVLDFKLGGYVEVTTQLTEVEGLEPVVHVGLVFERQEATIVSQLRWLRIGFIRIPAAWLPQNIVAAGAIPGEAITQQIPPEFILVGLATTPDGINLQLTWTGP